LNAQINIAKKIIELGLSNDYYFKNQLLGLKLKSNNELDLVLVKEIMRETKTYEVLQVHYYSNIEQIRKKIMKKRMLKK